MLRRAQDEDRQKEEDVPAIPPTDSTHFTVIADCNGGVAWVFCAVRDGFGVRVILCGRVNQ